MEGPYSARLPSSPIGEKSRRAPPIGRLQRVVSDEEMAARVTAMSIASGHFAHTPVMRDEILEVFSPLGTEPRSTESTSLAQGVFLDATLGAGGHARAILDAHAHLTLIGLDRDANALEAAAAVLAPHAERVRLVHAPFERLAEELEKLGIPSIVGVLFDLGVSSPQLDHADRGFSFRNDGPLDMRMDRSQGDSAEDIVNRDDERDLASVLQRFGDERFATRIARAIVQARPVTTTAALAELVKQAIPAAARRRGGHPATRTFQALRIEVNRELEQLPGALDDAIALLAPGGRGAVLSYHSGEDRIVKDRFRTAETGGCTCPSRLPCNCGATPSVRLVWRGAHTPSPAELERNPRAASARLRAVEKLTVGAVA
jgi:16S rRNA (cytosine1402-N4)-methyltransferase